MLFSLPAVFEMNMQENPQSMLPVHEKPTYMAEWHIVAFVNIGSSPIRILIVLRQGETGPDSSAGPDEQPAYPPARPGSRDRSLTRMRTSPYPAAASRMMVAPDGTSRT
jgi:hypothetical protein